MLAPSHPFGRGGRCCWTKPKRLRTQDVQHTQLQVALVLAGGRWPALAKLREGMLHSSCSESKGAAGLPLKALGASAPTPLAFRFGGQ